MSSVTSGQQQPISEDGLLVCSMANGDERAVECRRCRLLTVTGTGPTRGFDQGARNMHRSKDAVR